MDFPSGLTLPKSRLQDPESPPWQPNAVEGRGEILRFCAYIRGDDENLYATRS